jgi:uncharacterized protein
MNRLSREPSPYLRQHADNPVDWYPWGEEALARARREDTPILLSVGYSACHWCHVMAHESFEDPATAELMNRHFINIKVDREERPDVDHLYQGVVQLMGRGGGWPLTVFLTPELKPFYGGTYFPPAARHGLPGFPTLLGGIADAWVKARGELLEQAQTFEQGLTEYAAYGLDGAPSGALTGADVVAAAEKLAARIDPAFGGFGSRGPKFPNPMNLALLLRGHRRTGNRALLDGALLTLEKMALGGVADQLGGGFHRYSVDERWRVPHFEKMLYDNAQLLHLYAEAMQLQPRPLWRKTAEALVGWLLREMTAPEGGFYAAQDADSEGEEGTFFVWTPAELSALFSPADASLVAAHFGVTAEGTFEHGASVLEVATDAQALAAQTGRAPSEVEAVLSAAAVTMFEARARRVAPGIDDKVLMGWNGLMIRGLAFAARVFRRPEWLTPARRAADFVLRAMRDDQGTWRRSFHSGAARVDAMLEDCGDFALGLVTLAQAAFEPRYLEEAERLADLAVTRFWDPSRRAYFIAPRGQGDLLVPTYSLTDNAFPSGASTLTDAQVTLAALTGRARHLEQAQAYLEQLHGELTQNPMAYGHLWLAADTFLDGAAEVSVVGTREASAPLLHFLDAQYLPTVAVHALLDGAPVPEVSREVLSGRLPRGPVAAYLCRSFACQAPVADVEALRVTLGGLLGETGRPPREA